MFLLGSYAIMAFGSTLVHKFVEMLPARVVLGGSSVDHYIAVQSLILAVLQRIIADSDNKR